MIKSFKHRGLKEFYTAGITKLLNPDQLKRIERLLDQLDAADTAEGMRFPGARLHKLKGERKDTWSVWVSGNWRITFRFAGGHAYEVNLEDYH